MKRVLILAAFAASCAHPLVNDVNETRDGQFLYWESMNEEQKRQVLELTEVGPDVLAFYRGEFRPSDDPRTSMLLRTLSDATSEDPPFPLYFFLLNRICIKSDGALSELMGDHCLKVTLNSPEYVLGYLRDHEELLIRYSRYMGSELQFKAEGVSNLPYDYAEFKNILTRKLKNPDQYQDVLTRLFEEIDRIFATT